MIPSDVARCAGHTRETLGGIGFRMDCLTCERRLAGIGTQPPRVVWTHAPTETPCPLYRPAREIA